MIFPNIQAVLDATEITNNLIRGESSHPNILSYKFKMSLCPIILKTYSGTIA